MTRLLAVDEMFGPDSWNDGATVSHRLMLLVSSRLMLLTEREMTFGTDQTRGLAGVVWGTDGSLFTTGASPTPRLLPRPPKSIHNMSRPFL